MMRLNEGTRRMNRLVLSAVLALGVTSGARGQTMSLDNPSVLNGIGDVLVYLDKCGDLRPSAKIIWLDQLNKMINYVGGDRVLDARDRSEKKYDSLGSSWCRLARNAYPALFD
jgi:hypothetical protein